MPPIRKEFLVTKQIIEVNIEKAGSVTNTIRDYVHLKQPEEKDLYDVLYAVGEATPQSVGYRSPDSYQVDYEKWEETSSNYIGNLKMRSCLQRAA